MAYDYIRRSYGVDGKIGQRVTVNGKTGVIVRPQGDPSHFQVRFDGQKHTVPCHPTWKLELGDLPPPHEGAQGSA
jgi:hypothetical protein